MNTQFSIQSSDPILLEKATRIAKEYAEKYLLDEIVGIVFLGGIARGYFDPMADIDIAIFPKEESQLLPPDKFTKIEGMEVQCWWADYETELTTPWDMSKRWTYSQRQIYYDPQGKIIQLLEEKVPLKQEEKKWLLMSNFILSEWYFNRLSGLWVERGNTISAHHMFDQGLNYFFEMLFILNDQLVADMKWRYYCVEKLARLPRKFQERTKEIMTLHALSLEELGRRKEVFLEMWRELLPIVEEEVQLTFEEMEQLV